MIIFGCQFFKEMINYREHTKELKDNQCEQLPRLDRAEKESIHHKSIGYLTSIILNIIGSFFIWFHIILFLTILFSLLSFRAFTAHINRLEFLSSIISFVAPLLVLYGLKKAVTQWLGVFISSDQDQDQNQNSLPDEKSYAVLMYFTFISSNLFPTEESVFTCLFHFWLGCHIVVFSSILRLIKGIGINLILMPRINCSYLPRIYEKSGKSF